METLGWIVAGFCFGLNLCLLAAAYFLHRAKQKIEYRRPIVRKAEPNPHPRGADVIEQKAKEQEPKHVVLGPKHVGWSQIRDRLERES